MVLVEQFQKCSGEGVKTMQSQFVALNDLPNMRILAICVCHL